MDDRGGGGVFDLSATDEDVLWVPSPEKRVSSAPLSPQVEEWFQPSRSATMHTDQQSGRAGSPPSIPRRQRWKKRIWQRLPKKRIVRRVLKCSLAYFLSTLFTLIRPVANALGPVPFLCSTGMLFSHPGRTVGAQVDTTVMACMGILLSIAYGVCGVAVSAAGHQPFASIFLFYGIFAASALRQQWPRFFFFSLHFMVLQIFTLTAAGPHLTLPLIYGIPMLIGCAVSLLVNIVVWPESATDNLGRTVQETMQNCRETLVALTEQFFLIPTVEPMEQQSINQLVERMRKSTVKMRGAYREAKYEISYTYMRPQELLEIRKALERVVKRLGALSGSLRSERMLFGREYDVDATVKRKRRRTDNRHILYNYLERLRDPLTRLSTECADTLQYLANEFDEDQPRNARNTKEKRPQEQTTPTIHLQEFDNEEKERICSMHLREELFLVVFFMFTLRQIATEIETMASTFRDLLQRRGNRKTLYIPKPVSRRWLRKYVFSSNHQSTRDKGGYTHAFLERNLDPDGDEQEKIQNDHEVDLERNASRAFIAQEPATTATAPTAPCTRKPWMLRLRHTLWRLLKHTTKYEFRFALKMAVAVTALCTPAFVPWTAAWFARDRGQWAAVTVVAIMNPTSGGTLHASLWRIVGTVIGSLVGWAALETGQGDAYVLAVFAAALAIPCFYIHLGSTYNKVGVVVLITYVALALVHYTLPNDSIHSAVWKRLTSVIVGIVVSMILNSLVWPFVARHATRRSVSGIIRRLGEHYTYLVGTFLYHDPRVPPSDAEIKCSRKMEGQIQSSVSATYILLELTDHEPRLKGPFPKAFYREILDSCQNILDLLGCMRATMMSMSATVKQELCSKNFHADRRDMMAAIMLHFYAVSSSLQTKVALPVFLPSMRAARMRLIHHRREIGDQRVKFSSMSWYAMANCSEEIVEELEHLTRLVRFILGDPKFAERAKRMAIPRYPTEGKSGST